MMKRFFLNILKIGGIFLIVLIGFELILLTVTNRYSYKRNYVERHLNDISMLFLGNCHIENGLMPHVIGDSCFNMAISGREYQYDVALARQYVPRMRNLKVLVMPVDYLYMGLGRELPNARDLKPQVEPVSTFRCMYYRYMGIRVDGWCYASEILNSDLNYKERLWMTREQARECDSLGFIQLMDADRNKVWQHWDLPPIIDTTMPINQAEYALRYGQYAELARLTTRRGIRLVLVSTPMYTTYRADMNPRAEADIHVFVARLQREFQGVEYYDYTHDERFVATDFHDASHLSESGSLKFSKFFAAEAIRR